MSGCLLVIEGLDGCGKATQAALLAKTLADEGVRVRRLEFPCYESESSALVKMYLRGDFGSDPLCVNCYAASAFYAVDRAASYLSDWKRDYEEGAVLIADRYTTSNAVYQAAKLPLEEREDYLNWLFEFEYEKLALPAPDAVIYLDMSPEASAALLKKRYEGEESKKDIHERDLSFQHRCREAALACAKGRAWHIISCDEDEKPLSPEEIAREVERVARLFVKGE